MTRRPLDRVVPNWSQSEMRHGYGPIDLFASPLEDLVAMETQRECSRSNFSSLEWDMALRARSCLPESHHAWNDRHQQVDMALRAGSCRPESHHAWNDRHQQVLHDIVDTRSINHRKESIVPPHDEANYNLAYDAHSMLAAPRPPTFSSLPSSPSPMLQGNLPRPEVINNFQVNAANLTENVAIPEPVMPMMQRNLPWPPPTHHYDMHPIQLGSPRHSQQTFPPPHVTPPPMLSQGPPQMYFAPQTGTQGAPRGKSFVAKWNSFLRERDKAPADDLLDWMQGAEQNS